MRQRRHRGAQLITTARGMTGGEADALDAGNGVDRFEQTRQGFEITTGGCIIGRPYLIAGPVEHHALPQQRHLTHPGGGQCRHFGENTFGGAAPFAAAHRRNDAIGAAPVAAEENIDERRDATLVMIGEGLDRLFLHPRIKDRPLPGGHHVQYPRNGGMATRTHRKIQAGHAVENRRLQALDHATHHANHAVGELALGLDQQPQLAQRLVFGFAAHTAAVDNNDIGLTLGDSLDKPMAREQPRNRIGVALIHLAAVCL